MRTKIFALGLLMGCFSAHADEANLTNLQKSIFVNAKNPEFTIRLKSNATTGYQWLLKNYDDRFLMLEEHHYLAPSPSKMVGVGGVEAWTFKVKPAAFVAPQVSQVELVYAQPWSAHLPVSTMIQVVTEQQ